MSGLHGTAAKGFRALWGEVCGSVMGESVTLVLWVGSSVSCCLFKAASALWSGSRVEVHRIALRAGLLVQPVACCALSPPVKLLTSCCMFMVCRYGVQIGSDYPSPIPASKHARPHGGGGGGSRFGGGGGGGRGSGGYSGGGRGSASGGRPSSGRPAPGRQRQVKMSEFERFG